MDERQETAKREKCPMCGETRMINNHYLQHQRHDRVFVECAHCGHLVAKYILRNYLDPGFHYQQFLKLAKIHQDFSSGRKAIENFQILQERAKTQFEKIKNLLKKNDEDDKQSLQSLLSKYHVLEDSYQPFDE
mgnify:CR=1 FL=1